MLSRAQEEDRAAKRKSSRKVRLTTTEVQVSRAPVSVLHAGQPGMESLAVAYVHANSSLFKPQTGNSQLMAYYASFGPLAKAAVDGYALSP